MEIQKPQIGINSTSGDWFKIKIDRKTLKELSRRSDFEGWKHIIIYFVSLLVLGLLCYSSWGTGGLFQYIWLTARGGGCRRHMA